MNGGSVTIPHGASDKKCEVNQGKTKLIREALALKHHSLVTNSAILAYGFIFLLSYAVQHHSNL